jgi:predicted glutamine amidotransferase
MVGAPAGMPGTVLAEPFLRMARGENATNEKNVSLGLVRHPDGWGAVVAAERGVTRLRSARPCWEDDAFSGVRSSSVRLLHARLASSGGLDAARAHPFEAEVAGATWWFCHNGTLFDEPEDGTDASDSERFFRRMAPLLVREDPVRAFEQTASCLSRITALNALLLGPDGLWAFCVWSDPRCREYYTLVWADTAYGVLVASEPLPDVAPRFTRCANGHALFVPATIGAEARAVSLRLPPELTRAVA